MGENPNRPIPVVASFELADAKRSPDGRDALATFSTRGVDQPMNETNARGSAPSAALKLIGDALVGKWKLSGGVEGEIRYEWMDGGRFLIQHVDLKAFGRQIKGIEIIGNLQRLGEQPSEDVWTRFYSGLDGLTLDYVYELRGKELTIWFMKKNSGNRFIGTISDDGQSYSGAWAWPGGGYEVTGKRMDEPMNARR